MSAAPLAPSPKKSLGQHFLFDKNILGKIVRLAGVIPGEAVLEIGPGPGGLTRALLDTGARVWAVETDRRMIEHLREGGFEGVEIIEGDALRTDYLQLAKAAGEPFRLVANLPYNISGPLLALLLKERQAFKSMTLMFQKEVAQRIAAGPGGRVRGNLSVLAQIFCEVKVVMKVPPGAFRPPPKVESAVIRLDPLAKTILPIDDEETLWSIVGESFQHRRKMLRNCLRDRLGEGDELLERAGLKGTERPEELDSAQWIRLANEVFRSES
jgi:16S rRNA (adenine1518-N6/adenine1519-N6)-dimethyltransferase